MQKYRKWTDEATGINPFIIADQKRFNIVYNITTIVKSILVFCVLIIISPLIILSTILPFLSSLIKILLVLCGNVLSFDDNKLSNDLAKLNKKKQKVILSNYSSLIDVFYLMCKIPGASFLVIHESSNGQQTYQLTRGFGCLLKVLTKRQPFFVKHQDNQLTGQKSLKNIIQENSANAMVVFYEGIRTNGLGTIKMSRILSQKLYESQTDYLICKISYTPRDELFFNMVRSPFFNFWRLLGSLQKRSLKARSQITDISTIHNAQQLKKDVDSYMSSNGSKLLETNPQDYNDFIDFFYKTQKSDYVHQNK